MEENREITDTRTSREISNANLKRTAGPGRPKGSRNFKTVQWEAIKKIAEARNTTPEQIEEMINEVGLLKAMKGDYNFYRDYMDRNHGKIPETHLNVVVAAEPSPKIKELTKLLNQ